MNDINIRVLFVGFMLLGDQSATGHTLKNLFEYCPNVELLQYCLDYSADFHNTNNETIYLSSRRSLLYTGLKKLYRHRIGQQNTGSASVSAVHGGKKNIVAELGKAILDILPKRVSMRSQRKLDNFQPSVIYTLAENISTLKTVHRLSKRYNIPVVVHVMDDVESTQYNSLAVLTPFRKRYLSMLNKVYRQTVWNLAIGPKMAQEYEKRHEIKFSYAMNCVDKLSVVPFPNHDRQRLVFSGGLHGGRAESLYEIGRVIQTDEVLSEKVRLCIYTSKDNMAAYGAKISSVAEVMDYVPSDQIFENLGKADILVHVVSFDKEEIAYFRYSMSTKIPEYLSVGRPIFCYGSDEIATVAYLAEKKVGVVATNLHDINSTLRKLLLDRTLREELGNRAAQIAQEEYLGSVVGKRMEDVFRGAIVMWKNVSMS